MSCRGKFRFGHIIIAVSMVLVGWLLGQVALWQDPHTALHDMSAQSEAIVLLAGNHRERAPAAAFLYHKGCAPFIILTNDGVFSRWSTKYNRNLYQIEWAEEELVSLGVPRDKIVKLPYYGSSTMFDALALKRYILPRGLKKFTLVTSEFHGKRALWTFRYAIGDVTTDIVAAPVPWTQDKNYAASL